MATANCTLRTTIETTEQVTAASGIGKESRRTHQSFSHAFTTANYTSLTSGIGQEIWNYIYSASGSVSFLQGEVLIANVTAAATPAGYSSNVSQYTYNAATPSASDVNEAQANEPEHYRLDFTLGKDDFTSAATLASVLQTKIAAAIAQTPGPYA